MPRYCEDPYLVIVLKVTEKAALLDFVDEEEEIWIPLSQIEDGDDLEEDEDTEVEVYLTEFIARQKNLI